jgi:hypothetical protein
MMTGRLVAAASIAMTVHLVAHAAMMIVHLVVRAVMMTARVVAHAAMMIVRLVAAVSIVMTVRHVVAVSIVMIVHLVVRAVMMIVHLVAAALIAMTVRAGKIRAQQRSVDLTKSVCEPVDVEQQVRCLVRQTAPAKSGLMKVPRGQRVVPQVFVQRQRDVHKKAAARKFAHSTAWWKSLSAPLVRVHQFAL